MNTISERIFVAYSMLIGRIERAERGASMTEYAILVAIMAGVVALAVGVLGGKISSFIGNINITT